MHLTRHPERNWSIILQQVWSMKLRDGIPRGYDNNHNSRLSSSSHGKGTNTTGCTKVNEPRHTYNSSGGST